MYHYTLHMFSFIIFVVWNDFVFCCDFTIILFCWLCILNINGFLNGFSFLFTARIKFVEKNTIFRSSKKQRIFERIFTAYTLFTYLFMSDHFSAWFSGCHLGFANCCIFELSFRQYYCNNSVETNNASPRLWDNVTSAWHMHLQDRPKGSIFSLINCYLRSLIDFVFNLRINWLNTPWKSLRRV